jgi:hypothetical protein
MSCLESRAVKFIRAALSPGPSDPATVRIKANLQRPEKSTVKEPKDVPPRTATAPQPENTVEDSQPFASSGGIQKSA